ncbi:MAG TPA: Fe2+-dependent dioxygenase [Gammaproteobacteria bacterium]|nr:Fe2+-dependent dioxygenase [Gammaproteobacteria bacterium]
MLLQLKNILDPAKLDNIREMLAKVPFIDGKHSAGMAAEQVKNNEEMQQGTQQAQYLDQLVMGSLAENADFRSAALPLRVAQPVFARYTPGMRYGNHVDDPIMGGGMEKFRTDVAITVFLNAPQDYDGGELVIQSPFGEQRVKYAAGDAVLYPANSVHRVEEVSRGERLVAVIWLQSMVRDAAQRELLFELDQARNTLLQRDAQDLTAQQVDRAYVNLIRRWSDV